METNGNETPVWGDLVYHADYDVLAFALLFQGGLHWTSYYHATQAIEKYLKVLALSIADPEGRKRSDPSIQKVLTSHKLAALGNSCGTVHTYYATPQVQATLARFEEFDQATRYPWVERKSGNGFTGADVPVICGLLLQLRTDIPIVTDDYPLGMIVRGYHHKHHGIKYSPRRGAIQAPALAAARAVIPNLGQMVRW